MPYVRHANKEAQWNFDLTGAECCQFTEYGEGEYYDWHYDSFEKPWNNSNDSKFYGKIRKLSVTISLSDPKKYKGIIALSGCISINEFENEIDYDHVKNLNVFMGNGRQDKIITLPLAQKTRDDISKLEVKLNYKEYDVEHTISNDCLNDFLIWINTVLL